MQCGDARHTTMSENPYKLNVLLTVDTELSPSRGAATASEIEANLGSSIYGTPAGEYGLPFQLQCLRERDLKAVFFVEALSPIAAGLPPLQEVVDLVQNANQEVQLHIHTEWLEKARENPLGHRTGQNMHAFSEAEQSRVVEMAKGHLEKCGVSPVTAFRAGNYGANNDTLRALARNGIRFDSSYNYTYLGQICRIDTQEMLTQPTLVDGVWEVPITCFSDRPGNFRHAQLCACSFTELSRMMLQAHAAGMSTFVIVSHSFELINRARTRANKLLVARFRRLCRFLSEREDLFRTVGFNDLTPRATASSRPLASPVWLTAGRYAEQLLGRIYE